MDQASDMDQTNDADRSNTYSAWLCRVQLETNCEADHTWPQLNSQNQGKHHSQRDDQHYSKSFRKYLHNMSLDTCSEDSLDLSEYPELGEKRVKTKNRQHHIDLTPAIVVPHVEIREKHRKVVGHGRFKRTEKISFDLRKALESAEHYAFMNPKVPMRLKANIYRVHTNPCNKNSSTKTLEIKKVKIYNINPKKPSSLKQKILQERWINKRTQYQEGKIKEIEDNCMDVNSINFNTLKIKSDPEIDIDYVKRMSTLTVYDKDYRDLKVENIPEDTVQYRPDITKKLDNLRISNIFNRNICTTSYASPLDNTDDLNTLQNTLCLESEDDIDQKPDIKLLFNRDDLIKFSKNFREYCNNIVTPSLNESLEKFLSEIKRLQTKFYNRDQNKGKYKRRYYTGLKEVRKHVALKKIRFVVIARDIEKIQCEGGLDDEVNKLLEACRKNESVFCFCLRRRKLGYYMHGNGFVSCIGITNYSNTEELFWDVLVNLAEARNKFEELRGRSEKMIDVSKIIHDNALLSENIGILLKTLASIN